MIRKLEKILVIWFFDKPDLSLVPFDNFSTLQKGILSNFILLYHIYFEKFADVVLGANLSRFILKITSLFFLGVY